MLPLNFEVIHQYDAGESGITVPAQLQFGEQCLKIAAKLDTGSAFCVFSREHGEDLDLEIESGMLAHIATPMGSFKAYGHEITLAALGFELNVMVYFASAYGFERNVLGRHGWMQQLRIGIVDYEGLLYLGLYDQDVS